MTAPHDDPDRDAWLSEALRHAPDANAAPSAEISDSILRQARNAVKTPQPARSANPLLQWWSWLARPPVAAGFATVMLATLVGVMWWDKPLDETLPSSPAPTISEAPAAAPARSAKLAQSRAPGPEAEQRAARNEASVARDAAVNVERERVQDEARQRKAETVLAAPAATPAQLPRPAPTTLAPVAPAPAPAPAAAPVAESAGRAATQNFAKSAAAPAPVAARDQSADLRTPLIDDVERWGWQRGDGIRAMTPALQRWLAQLDATARWRPVDPQLPPAASEHEMLKLWRNGTLQATILVVPNTAWLWRPGGRMLQAQLSDADSVALRLALIEATP